MSARKFVQTLDVSDGLIQSGSSDTIATTDLPALPTDSVDTAQVKDGAITVAKLASVIYYN
jgi:hypothetical protein